MGARKFLYGDTVVIKRRSAVHNGHTGKIDGTLIKRAEETRPKTYYQVICECGSGLRLEAFSMDIIGTPMELPDVPITEMRIRYFLKSIKASRKTVDSALSRLSERERDILERRNGLTGEDKQTLKEIAQVIGVSSERVRAIEASALAKLHTKKGRVQK